MDLKHFSSLIESRFKKDLRQSKGDYYKIEQSLVSLFSQSINFDPRYYSIIVNIIINSPWIKYSDKIQLLLKIGDLDIKLKNDTIFDVNKQTEKSIFFYVNHRDIKMLLALSHVGALKNEVLIYALKKRLDLYIIDLIINIGQVSYACLIRLSSTYIYDNKYNKFLVLHRGLIPQSFSGFRNLVKFKMLLENSKYNWIILKLIESDKLVLQELILCLERLNDSALIHKLFEYAIKKKITFERRDIKLLINVIKRTEDTSLIQLILKNFIGNYLNLLHKLWNEYYKLKENGNKKYFIDLKNIQHYFISETQYDSIVNKIDEFIRSFSQFRTIYNNS